MKNEFSLETEMKKLEEVEQYFQRPDMKLDEAITKHQEALAIAKGMLEYLSAAESKIEKLDLRSVGKTDEL